ncbi:hypothetical protein PRZ48_004542 [Zasmidium cellare]|uniref:Uncharacterized protein n=1 Tax=Zasmidium cellare TaxID=395010 RepID=A0ABR0EPT6_ZASCE|nr:hypothetical protein PRZ48_004542 [Zasmidium cellare]
MPPRAITMDGEDTRADQSVPASPSLLGIPNELRRMIFSYLLRGEDKAQETIRRLKYAYHTAILKVNGKLHGQAEEYLFEENTFVLVTYVWRGFSDVLQHQMIPVVFKYDNWDGKSRLPQTLKNLHGFFHVSVEGKREHWVTDTFSIPRGQASNEDPHGAFIILWRDFSKLMSAISWRYDALCAPRIYVHDTGLQYQSPLPRENEPSHIQAFLELNTGPQSPHRLQKLLKDETFKSVLQSIDGLRTCYQNNHSCALINAPLITVPLCLKQKLWRNIQTAFTMKETADRLARQGHIEGARALYFIIAEHGFYGQLDKFEFMDGVLRQSHLFPYAEQLALILNDAVVCGMYLALRQLDGYEAVTLFARRDDITNNLNPPWWGLFGNGALVDDEDSKWDHKLLAFQHMEYLMKFCLAHELPRSDVSDYLRQMQRDSPTALAHPDHAAYWRHDLAVFERFTVSSTQHSSSSHNVTEFQLTISLIEISAV